VLRYPPFTRLVLVRLDGVDRNQVSDQAHALTRELRRVSGHFQDVGVMGPAQAAMAKLVGRWRWQIVMRGKNIGPFRRFLRAARPVLEGAGKKGVRVSWDVDPRSLM
jgi:primosomal protein N' (replication factor Y)